MGNQWRESVSLTAPGWLQTFKVEWDQRDGLDESRLFYLNVKLIRIFSTKYKDSMKASLPERAQKIFDSIHRSFYEIQQRIEEGKIFYSDESHPKTAQLIRFRGGTSEEEFFGFLERASYGLV